MNRPTPTSAASSADEQDLVVAVLAHLRVSLSGDGRTPETASFASQEARLKEWADSLGLLLSANDLPSKAVKGGHLREILAGFVSECGQIPKFDIC